MNIFSNLPTFGEWRVVESRAFSAEEIAAVQSAAVVRGDYGLSVRINFTNGGYTFIPLSSTATVGIGANVDVTKAKLLTLAKSGRENIYRIEY